MAVLLVSVAQRGRLAVTTCSLLCCNQNLHTKQKQLHPRSLARSLVLCDVLLLLLSKATEQQKNKPFRSTATNHGAGTHRSVPLPSPHLFPNSQERARLLVSLAQPTITSCAVVLPRRFRLPPYTSSRTSIALVCPSEHVALFSTASPAAVELAPLVGPLSDMC